MEIGNIELQEIMISHAPQEIDREAVAEKDRWLSRCRTNKEILADGEFRLIKQNNGCQNNS